ncbi:hypothetical protein AKJ35_01485 [candidate division MSBL1 archaeon SCGC-AAA833F18]|uniref:lipoate--protein ligase n=1 Tax=candidate division MSBL1 archaeon SCGC-AAA833F18 TaxID=1698257 RepID=A0A133VRJ2_9EURY|nr:hypothetical protein AKJ35_01485 [candidate division MSBL1 archaeon SCGC-AAA833F18]
MPYAEFKAPKGVIKVELELEDNKISSLSLSGDFFMHPEGALDQLEETLINVRVEEEELLSTIQEFYDSTGVKTPMLEPKHWVKAILRAVGE